MTSLLVRAILSGILGLSLIASACGSSGGGSPSGQETPKPSVVVGGFGFAESSILASIYAGALKSKGYPATTKLNIGKREVVAPALQRGDIDMYPGYAATDLEYYNKSKGEATPDAKATTAKLNTYLNPLGIKALDPSPAIDQNAFVVTKAFATQNNLKKMSDLKAIQSKIILGGPPECPTRPFCMVGLKNTYGINLSSSQFKPLDEGGPLTVAALDRGDINVALLFSSDGVIAAKNFVVLDDDMHLQNADNVVPIIKSTKATADVTSILNKVSAAITTADLSDMNKKAGVDKQDPEALAQAWLKSHGFA
jgi:osmoprotectant transport system substrate-binding protein